VCDITHSRTSHIHTHAHVHAHAHTHIHTTKQSAAGPGAGREGIRIWHGHRDLACTRAVKNRSYPPPSQQGLGNVRISRFVVGSLPQSFMDPNRTLVSQKELSNSENIIAMLMEITVVRRQDW